MKDLLVGSEFTFEDRGETGLKDIPGNWQLYSVN